MRKRKARCPTCGRALDDHEIAYRFSLPEAVLALPDRELTEGAWLNGDSAATSDFMHVPGTGSFLRAILAVRLTGGHSVEYGVWIGVDEDEAQRAFQVWWEPEYTDLRLTGRLASLVPPWGLLDLPVDVGVVHPDQLPRCLSSTDSELSQVLTAEWDHATVLDAVQA